MVQFNFAERTIKAKVVYYGPAQSGKTTNLEQIHRLTDPQAMNRLISLNTARDRTLFFDLLPFSLGAVSGYDFKIQLYTVPGQVQYNATRRVVLAGADAVVFVADSRKSMFKENLAAFENMKVNLLANRLVPEKVPLVLQYNKQDLPELQPDAELNRSLNFWKRPVFKAVAARGEGVLETFASVVQEMLAAIAVKYNLKDKGLDPVQVPQIVKEAFDAVLRQAHQAGAPAPGAAPAPVPARDVLEVTGASPAPTPVLAPAAQPSPVAGKVVLSQITDSLHAAPPQAAADTGLVSEELLHRSIRSNVELAESLANVVREMNLGLGTILSHAELLLIYREDARDKRASAIGAIQHEASRMRNMLQTLGASSGQPAAPPPPRPAAAPPTPVAPPPPPPVPAAPVVPPPASLAARAVAPSAPGPAPGFEALAQAATSALAVVLQSCAVTVDLRVLPGTALPRGATESVQRTVESFLEGIARASLPATVLAVRAERKPVLLRSREGEVKRDFLMVAVGHGGVFGPDEQQRITQGAEPGPMGQGARMTRELGGFVRFAPLPGGGLETRVFLPI